jgi:cold shock CspA family protein
MSVDFAVGPLGQGMLIMIGKIDVYFREKGFGFIVSLEGGRTTHFFHVSNVVEGAPVVDAPVEFDVAPPKEGTKRSSAVNVRVNGGAQ